jgi:hypothetical protein
MQDGAIEMTKPTRDKLLRAALILICILILAKYGILLEESEFPGGWLTGKLLNLYDVGLTLFAASFFLTFLWRRAAAVAGLSAALLCLPLFLYFTFPRVFRRLFPGEYSVPLLPGYRPDWWTILGLTVLALLSIANVGTLLARTPQQTSGE